MPGASEQTRRVKIVNANWVAGPDGDHGRFETHEAFVTRLRTRHGRKTGFWSQVPELGGVSGQR